MTDQDRALGRLCTALRSTLDTRDIPRTTPVALAVSGGADSLALLLAAHGIGQRAAVLTVDHGLRAEAAEECAYVSRVAASYGYDCHILQAEAIDAAANVQAQARRARYKTMEEVCAEADIPVLLTAHHRDDQVETFFERLARGSGVRGLRAMTTEAPGLFFPHMVTRLKPFLGVPKADILAALGGRELTPVDDPSNQDPRFDRVRLRAWLKEAPVAGLTDDNLVGAVRRIAQADAALEVWTNTFLRTSVLVSDMGIVSIGQSALAELPVEIGLRVLRAVLDWVAPIETELRARSVDPLHDALCAGVGANTTMRRTLAGCLVSANGAAVRISREAAAMPVALAASGGLYDGRWRVHVPDGEIGALGDAGWQQVKAEGGTRAAALQALAHVERQALPALRRADGRVQVAGLDHAAITLLRPHWVSD